MDPDWVENLNSVLDDKKLLTLPNGERVALSPNVRLFSVGDVCTCMCVWGGVWREVELCGCRVYFEHITSAVLQV